MNESFVFYRSFYKAAKKLDDEQYGKIMRILAEYALNGVEPDEDEMDAMALLAFTLMKPQIDANSRRRENGAKGGKPKNTDANRNQTVTENEPNSNLTETETKPNRNQTVTENEPNVNDNDNVNDNENDKEKDNANALSKKKSAKRFVPPTIDEVRAYCSERGNFVDPESFISFYESNGWKVGRNTMVDWKAAVRTWEHRDSRAAPTDKYAEIDRQFLERYKDDTE